MLKRVSLLLIVFVFAITSCGDASMRRKLWEIIRPNPEIRFYRSKSLNVGHWMTVETPQGNELQVFEHGGGVEGGTAIVFRSGRLGTNMRSVSHDPFKYAWSNITVETYTQNVGWWLYPPYEPTSPDYPYLLWMKTNPPRRFLLPPSDAVPISTPEDLDKIREEPDKYYFLTNDIDMSDWGDWEPIDGFSGTLDGFGYTIKNLRTRTIWDSGLFGVIWSGCTIRNLRLENVDIGGGYCTHNAGGLVAICDPGGAKVVIKNIYVSGNVQARNATGGVIGIVNSDDTEISYVYFSGRVYGSERDSSGGIIGKVYASNFTLYRCWAKGKIDYSGVYQAGGLIGEVWPTNGSVTISECASLCDVTSLDVSDVGGFIGEVYTDRSTTVISDCFCRGTVTANNRYIDVAGFTTLGYYHQANITVMNCYAAVPIKTIAEEADAFAEIYYLPTVISSCYYDGSLTRYGDKRALPNMRKGFLPPDWSREIWGIK